MVGKIVSSSAPYQCANYCLNHDGATILCFEGLDIDPSEAMRLTDSSGEERIELSSTMAYAIDTSFVIQAETNTSVKKPVGHISLCFMKEDAPLLDGLLMSQIAREYMEMMGYQNTQYMVVQHFNGKGNPHVHIFFNRVDNYGRCLNAWQDYQRNRVACRALADKYGLHLAHGRKNTIVQDLRTLGRELMNAGESMEIHRRNNGSIQGVSFSKGDDKRPSVVHRFRGSEVGRNYSYAKLMQAIDGRMEMSAGQHESDVKRRSDENTATHESSMAADIFEGIMAPSANDGNIEEDRLRKQEENEAGTPNVKQL